jgi:hypothetical protein
VEEQSSIIKNLERNLSRVLEMFPKISTIVLSHSYQTDHPEKYKSVLSIPHTWIQPFQLRALFRAISRSSAKITSIDTEAGSWCFDEGSGDDSKAVYIRYYKEKKPVVISSAFELDPKDLAITKSIFSNLTHLNLTIYSAIRRLHAHSPPPVTYWADLP